MATNLTVDVAWRLRHSWRAIALLRRVARFVATAEGFRHGDLSVVVVGSRAMSGLHRRHLNIDGPTDVLTFDLGCDRSRGLLDAEIVLCADVARTRAAARDARPATARAELALYLAHGVLHLADYDDQTPKASRRMHEREDEILVALGLGAVFRDGA